MSSAEENAEQADQEAKPKGGGRRRLVLFAVPPVLLAAAGGGLWFTGLLPHWLGLGRPTGPAKPAPPVFIDMPAMIANLDTDPSRPRYIKLKARIEVAGGADAVAVKRYMPRIVDLFQTYLRELRPRDLQGAAGTYRLREELLNRADVAVAPARIRNVLFVEMIVQ